MKKTIMKKTNLKKIIMIALLVFLFFGCVQTQGDFMGVNKNETNNLKETSDLNETNNLNDINKGAVYNNLNTLSKAKSGDIVRVDYVGRFLDNTIFDTSKKPGRTPLEFEVDSGAMIIGFNDAVKGMRVGETKTVTLAPSQAYGERNEKNVITLDSNNFADFNKLEVGMKVSGGNMVGTVISKTDTNAVIDFNPEMAGKTLVFEITLIEIVE